MKIAILGFGREGKSLLRFIKKNNPKAKVKILDRKFDTHYLKKLQDFNIVYRSPGVPYNLLEIQKAIKKGVKFSSATAIFFEKAAGKIIGITGTKGKGTTATLLYKILKACKKPVYLAGNIGKPTLEILPKINEKSIVVLELSSFQLQDLKVSPEIAVVLETFPDHMDSHKNLQEYFDAKTNIARWQKKSDKIFYFSDNRWSKWIAAKSRGKKISVSAKDSKLFKLEDLKMPGEHNLKNAVMATNVALSLGCPKNKILKVVRNFRGNEHRLELIRKTKGISFYNDSASTNPQTAAAAIRAFNEKKILISGGKDKGLNYSPLAKALKNSNTKLVILFGENKKKIQRQIARLPLRGTSGQAKSKAQIVLVKNLKSAVHLAYKTAKKQTNQLITIIFSPASASFDMFKNYADRGEKFKVIVKKLK